ncbi:DMT family transporter [Aeromonas hydrophila]|uniref:DMT family transporter n=1 Tax=Aeromonas hydrophila TaxID=644 RepID=UPI00191DD502|nr:DMT family transporter [Aeromonas hydrophila]MBL0572019.1 DMT family transporter [Aeromonas hydrophila]
MNLMLYLATVLIWGSTWIAIAWQLGPIPIEVSVLYRFALAALALFALLTASGRFPRLPWAGQRYAALLGGLLFSTNFLCFYHATLYIPSGLSAVIFASASIFNGLNLWLFEGKRPGLRWLQGSLLGLLGTLLLFWPVLADAQLGANGWKGLLLACGGTLCFSLGNLVSARGQRQDYHVLQLVPWGMVYGVVLLLGWVTLLGQQLVIPTDGHYLAAMVYLALFGSVIAFTAYLTLVGRIGASKASYATVLFPLVALTLSTFYEGFVWQPVSVVGVMISLLGNLVIFAPPLREWRLRPARAAKDA